MRLFHRSRAAMLWTTLAILLIIGLAAFAMVLWAARACAAETPADRRRSSSLRGQLSVADKLRMVFAGTPAFSVPVLQALLDQGHDIVAVDSSAKAVQYAEEHYDVASMVGYGASETLLKIAGVARADLVAAVTNHDEMNLIEFTPDGPWLRPSPFNGHYPEKRAATAPLTAARLQDIHSGLLCGVGEQRPGGNTDLGRRSGRCAVVAGTASDLKRDGVVSHAATLSVSTMLVS